MKAVILALVLGIIGTFLIFATEFGYTFRKSGVLKFGRLKSWLKVHIFIGIAGPLVIIWHTGLNFNGFAGALTAMTAIVVASGFVGRYIYRQIPHSLKGQELSLSELNSIHREIERRLQELLERSPRAAQLVKALRDQFANFKAAPAHNSGLLLFATSTLDWHIGRLKVRRLLAGGHPEEHALMATMQGLEFERLSLERRMRLLDTSKVLLARWRLLHRPLTLALLVGILIHVGGILYYGKVLP